MANDKSTFLIEEYKQLHESLYKSNEGIVTAIRFTITLFAAFCGAILVALVRENGIDKKQVFITIAAVSGFFFLICLLGSIFLLNSFKNVRRMLSAINAIRSYYVSIEKIPEECVVMPLPKNPQPFRLFGGWPAMYLAHIFATMFLLVCIVIVCLLSLSFPISIVVLICCVLATILISVVYGGIVQRALAKTTTKEARR
jgi:MFS family permease